jgi:hypothetical protein
MDITEKHRAQQEAKRLENRISSFKENFKIGTLLNSSGIRKIRGVSPLALFTVIFLLPFEGYDFYRGIVTNSSLSFKKDAAYDFLKNPRHNWRKFLSSLSFSVARFFDYLTDEKRIKVLIFDDSTYDRCRSKAVELLAWIHDHNRGCSLKGFRLLTLGRSDGVNFLPLDFALLSSAKADKRVQGITKKLDKRTCGYKRRVEAMTKSTDLLEVMVKRVLCAGLKVDYILMDSWFCFPVILAKLGQHVPVICMAKDLKSILYHYKGRRVRLSNLYKLLKKRRGKASLPASAVVKTSEEQLVKIVFVRHRHHKRKWLAILSTNVDLPDEEIVRIYGKRWDIEVFFKMLKHYLNLERETQLRDYDGLIGHITIVMSRYIFLAFEQRCQDDPRTLGSLFYACHDELQDLDFLSALQRIITIAIEKIRSAGVVTEDVVLAIVDSVMSTAIDLLQTSQRLARNNFHATAR